MNTKLESLINDRPTKLSKLWIRECKADGYTGEALRQDVADGNVYPTDAYLDADRKYRLLVNTAERLGLDFDAAIDATMRHWPIMIDEIAAALDTPS